MSPPPPPLGRRHKRAAQAFDAALDDGELVAARAALAQGRWQAVRGLLAQTGDEWDLRAHRVTVLALESYTAAWARDWLLAEPESADASVLLAVALVQRVLAGKEKPVRAREACRTAAARVPADPTPWLGLLLLEHSLGTDEGVVQLFDEVRHRHADHHHAHHLMVARLAERRATGGLDPLHEVYDFAYWAAEQAPADSPLAILPVVAHTERYRVLAAAGLEPADPAASGHWSGRRARQVMKAAFDWWLEGSTRAIRAAWSTSTSLPTQYCSRSAAPWPASGPSDPAPCPTRPRAAPVHRIGPSDPGSLVHRPAHRFRTARDHALGTT